MPRPESDAERSIPARFRAPASLLLHNRRLCRVARRNHCQRATLDPLWREVDIANTGGAWIAESGFNFDFSSIRLDTDPIVDSVLKTLLTAEVFFGSLDGNVSKQKLDLVQIPSSIAAQASASPTAMPNPRLCRAVPLSHASRRGTEWRRR
jgi:hypothetical protein